jgi:hypothetical protein
MRVALLTPFAASKKEPLAAMLDRVHDSFPRAGMAVPFIRFSFSDSPVGGGVSAVDRVLKRHSELARFAGNSSTANPMFAAARSISNWQGSPAEGEAALYETLQAVAAGVPRSFPFHSVMLHFQSPEFGELALDAVRAGGNAPGVLLTDSWWVNGRNRSLSGFYVVEASAAGRTLPPPPEPVAALFALLGKAKRAVQVPIPESIPAAPNSPAVPANPEILRAAREIAARYRGQLEQIVTRAGLPHDLPGPVEARQLTPLGQSTGPKKPVLERLFKPMGYTCEAGSGTYTLRRRTSANIVVQLYLDVGTWSRSVTAIYQVFGLGFKATLTLPVSANAMGTMQYPIGDSEQWQKIVENLAALVAELDRTMVPDIEAEAGPSPGWYEPSALG